MIHGPHGHVSIHNIHGHNNITYEHCWIIIDKTHDQENYMHSWPDNHCDIIIIVTIQAPHGHVSVYNTWSW